MRTVVATRIYRPEPAAASYMLGAVSDALVAAGHDVEVLTAKPLPGQGEGSRGERIRTFPVIRDRSGYVRGYVQYMSFDIPLAFRLLFRRRPDVVFVEPPPTTGAVVRVICALRRIPYVYDAADIWSDAAGHATDSALVVRVLRSVERFALRGATAAVTISSGVVERLRELGIRTPTTVTGFGADTTAFSYEELPLERTFVYAGTYTELHGAGILVDAFAAFLDEHPGYALRFIGQGTERERLQERARELGIEAAVEFRDPVTARELCPQLNAAVASLATLAPGGGYEYAFTSKIYSSMAAGCPVIFAGPGPTANFLEQNAAFDVGEYTAYDPELIAAAMARAVTQPLTPAARARLAAWTAEHHSLRAVGERIARVIAGAASRRRGWKA